MYAADYDERLPLAKDWMDVTEQYASNERIFHCPEERSRDRSRYGYAMNIAFAGKKRSDLDPKGLLAFDSAVLGRNAAGSPGSMPTPGRHELKSGKMDNAVLVDGSSMAEFK
jgi:hypothetical protein